MYFPKYHESCDLGTHTLGANGLTDKRYHCVTMRGYLGGGNVTMAGSGLQSGPVSLGLEVPRFCKYILKIVFVSIGGVTTPTWHGKWR
jgi:hypothetical protein